jgi:hypothetical protein
MSLVSPGLVKNVGPGFTEFINKEVQTEEDALRNIRQKEIDFCKASIAGEQAAQVFGSLQIQIMWYFLAVSGPDQYGLLPWIRIRIPIGMRNRIQRQGRRPKLKNKPDFQLFIKTCTYVGMFNDLLPS